MSKKRRGIEAGWHFAVVAAPGKVVIEERFGEDRPMRVRAMVSLPLWVLMEQKRPADGKPVLLSPEEGMALLPLAWAVEGQDFAFVARMRTNWAGLHPCEQRWFYTQIRAMPARDPSVGWLAALRVALLG